MMHYTYVEAWSILGIVLPHETPSFEVCSSDTCRFTLTSDPDALLATIDRGLAIGDVMLARGGLGRPDLQTAVSSIIEEIQISRRNRILNQAVLVIEAHGDIAAPLNESFKEFDEFIVSFDSIDIHALAQAHRPNIESMKAAIAFESEAPSRFNNLSSGAYLTDVRGKIIHDISFSLNASGFSSITLTPEDADRILDRYSLLQQTTGISKIQQLLSQLLDYNNNQLKAFISGWTAIEILIQKSFNQFGKMYVLTDLPATPSATISNYSLGEKFYSVAAVLFPDDVDQDSKKFYQLKKLRNSIHYDELLERDLPVHEVSMLLGKYMLACIGKTTC